VSDVTCKLTNCRLTDTQLEAFQRDGYLVIPRWEYGESLKSLQGIAKRQLDAAAPPLELEAQLGYPGAPEATSLFGSETPRRLLGAYQREPLWREFAVSDSMAVSLRQLFDDEDICLSQAHHNCLMTKSPRYSSDTGWHQDSRYWSFDRPELITAWLALGEETKKNGVLRVIPGSHRMKCKSSQFDSDLFFSANSDDNMSLISEAKALSLSAGDLVFFHCKLLHSATRNTTEMTKLSLVFTYHRRNNRPLAGSRSASVAEILLV